MDPTTLKIALAGLLHDIGKFAQGSLDVSERYKTDNADLYQPSRDGRHSHIHALYTAAFIEQFSDAMPTELNKADWGDGGSFINLAAMHHKPESVYQQIVTVADWISSGVDRAVFESGKKVAFQDVQKTRLLPLFEELRLENRLKNIDQMDSFEYSYPLKPISAASVFPEERQKPDRQAAADEYRTLFNSFCDGFRKLLHKNSSLELWSQHLDSLLTNFTSAIPAARVKDIVPDVSLYDHMRTTAALAAALYLFHDQTGTMTEEKIREMNPSKLLLLCGDFYGIQEFIFSSGGETSEFRSKLLRGRSFAVSLFSELAADKLCRAIGLPFLSIVLNAAGKFLILAPNTPDTLEQIFKAEREINDWLFRISYGQSSFGIADLSATPSNFMEGGFEHLWDELNLKMDVKKQQKLNLDRYGGVISGYLDGFDSRLDEKQLCPFCNCRPSDAKTGNDRYLNPIEEGNTVYSCPVCRDHIMLGTKLVKNNHLVVLNKEVADDGLSEPLFGTYQVQFTNHQGGKAAQDANLIKYWNLNATDEGTLSIEMTTRLINGYVPVYTRADEYDDRMLKCGGSDKKKLELIDQINEGAPKTFAHLACRSLRFGFNGKKLGTEALGILKADVDNLGALMSCGLPEKHYTISRIATLSRQLNNYFTLYLPYLLNNDERFNDIYTVFAGGDDLFLIGPWPRIIELAGVLRETFDRYVCRNPEITLSAGITLHKQHTPVDRLAETTETALEMAKEGQKNQINLFQQTSGWSMYAELDSVKSTWEEWLGRGLITSGMLYRFNALIDKAGREKRLAGKKVVDREELDCLDWRSKLFYLIARNAAPGFKGEERQQRVDMILEKMAAWMSEYGSTLRIPLWRVLYDKR